METKKTVLTVEGMTCKSCVAHVTRALADLVGVTKVDVRLAEGTATVDHDPSLPVERMVAVLRDAGYASATTAER